MKLMSDDDASWDQLGFLICFVILRSDTYLYLNYIYLTRFCPNYSF